MWPSVSVSSSFEDLQTGLSPTWSSYRGFPPCAQSTEYDSKKSFSLGRHCLFLFFIIVVAFTYETSNFSVAILETPLGRATMILIESVRLFHWTSTLHTLRGKKKGGWG